VDVEMVFLDAGNTLVTIDWEQVAEALAEAGRPCTVEQLVRAEAASRPEVSRFAAGTSTEARDTFAFTVEAILSRVEPLVGASVGELERLAAELTARLKHPGRADLLWRRPIPGAAEALRALAEQGLRLAVVSNSDGTVEHSLELVGVRELVERVFDSSVVGFEKPDPRLFEHALATTGARAERTVYVGDLYDIDALGARAAGLRPVLVDPFGDWAGVDCERVAELGELPELLATA
jgi:putative hydrolase of the HAD superfamily